MSRDSISSTLEIGLSIVMEGGLIPKTALEDMCYAHSFKGFIVKNNSNL